MHSELTRIRFPQSLFPALRRRLLADPTREAFAVLFAQRHSIAGATIYRVVDVHYPQASDYGSRGQAHLRIHRTYILERLAELQHRGDVDTLMDVHTHPFSPSGASFSAVDDRDEKTFAEWLSATVEELHYASIVLSHSDYAARVWGTPDGVATPRHAQIRAQIIAEDWPDAVAANRGKDGPTETALSNGPMSRNLPVVGLEVLRRIMSDQTITVVGVGGLGSIIAENLIHSGFRSLNLIDHDRVEVTNLNRLVGAYYGDALQERLKVDVVREHLQRINPNADVAAYPFTVESPQATLPLMQADWIILATDNHGSRFFTQLKALELGIPMLSAGVNITVAGGRVLDESGEIVIARYGDNLCLNCLRRINPLLVSTEGSVDPLLFAGLSKRGYVTGATVHEPAVKTLNAIVAAQAVNAVINQYTERQPHAAILVYENNTQSTFYQDHDSVRDRLAPCAFCTRDTRPTSPRFAA